MACARSRLTSTPVSVTSSSRGSLMPLELVGEHLEHHFVDPRRARVLAGPRSRAHARSLSSHAVSTSSSSTSAAATTKRSIDGEHARGAATRCRRRRRPRSRPAATGRGGRPRRPRRGTGDAARRRSGGSRRASPSAIDSAGCADRNGPRPRTRRILAPPAWRIRLPMRITSAGEPQDERGRDHRRHAHGRPDPGVAPGVDLDPGPARARLPQEPGERSGQQEQRPEIHTEQQGPHVTPDATRGSAPTRIAGRLFEHVGGERHRRRSPANPPAPRLVNACGNCARDPGREDRQRGGEHHGADRDVAPRGPPRDARSAPTSVASAAAHAGSPNGSPPSEQRRGTARSSPSPSTSARRSTGRRSVEHARARIGNTRRYANQPTVDATSDGSARCREEVGVLQRQLRRGEQVREVRHDEHAARERREQHRLERERDRVDVDEHRGAHVQRREQHDRGVEVQQRDDEARRGSTTRRRRGDCGPRSRPARRTRRRGRATPRAARRRARTPSGAASGRSTSCSCEPSTTPAATATTAATSGQSPRRQVARAAAIAPIETDGEENDREHAHGRSDSG